MQIQTSRFGLVTYEENDVVRFPSGIPGFQECREWVFAGEADSPVRWIQSVEKTDVALPITDCYRVFADYNARIAEEDLEELRIDDSEDLALMVVVSIPAEKPWNMTANLRAPLVFNRVRHLGKQVVCQNEEYPMRAFVFPEEIRNYYEMRSLRQEIPDKTPEASVKSETD